MFLVTVVGERERGEEWEDPSVYPISCIRLLILFGIAFNFEADISSLNCLVANTPNSCVSLNFFGSRFANSKN